MLSSIRVVKAFAREDYEERRFEQQSLESVEMTLAARSIKARLAPMVDVIVAIGHVPGALVRRAAGLAGQLTAGALVVFLLYLGKMYKPMRDLSKMTDTVSKAIDRRSSGSAKCWRLEGSVRDEPHARNGAAASRERSNSTTSISATTPTSRCEGRQLDDRAGTIRRARRADRRRQDPSIISLIPRFYDPVSGGSRLTARTFAASL